jgi:hypothetical protein
VLHGQILKDAEQVVDEYVVERTVAAVADDAAAAAAAAAVPGRSIRIASFQQSTLDPRSAAHLPAHQHGAYSPTIKMEQKTCGK